MKIAFFGTSPFACPALKRIAREADVLLVCPPDRPAGRKMTPQPPPTKKLALELRLQVYQPEKIGRAARERIAEHKPDVLAVAASSFFLGPKALAVAPRGAFNAHPSLLPRHRGPSPIPQAILEGNAETGVTIIRMTAELDAGPIVAQERVRLDGTETAGTLESTLSELAAELLVRVLRKAREGGPAERPQDEARATYTPLLKKSDGLIDWSHPAESIERKVRAYDPWPTAHTLVLGRKLAITRAKLAQGEGAPGKVLAGSGEGKLLIACGKGAMEALEVHPAGKRRMTAAEYLRGRFLSPGARIGKWP